MMKRDYFVSVVRRKSFFVLLSVKFVSVISGLVVFR